MAEISVVLPDMFRSFLKEKPRISPHYERVKCQSEEWISSFCSLDSISRDKVHKCDFSFFCAIVAPDAEPEEFRTLCDWGNWVRDSGTKFSKLFVRKPPPSQTTDPFVKYQVFLFDDMFDDGELRDRPGDARKVFESLMMPMTLDKPTRGHRLRIVRVHDLVVERIWKTGLIGARRRFTRAMYGYCHGALSQVEDRFSNYSPSLEELICTRRDSSGCRPLFHLAEYAHGLKLPDKIFANPVIQELETLGIDMVAISNDLLSYQKEQAEDVPHNMVAVCQRNGMTPQEAFDFIGDLLFERYERWDVIVQRVPKWSSLVDKDVQKYIDGIKAVVRANLNWSFRSRRYFGSKSEQVRQTRVITLPHS